ncbi:hypothetical protein CHS0354_020584 [Potamilus streckersoni]|uniref:Uncharacterized protein n=1 Tax=Potamilus streckersoni TaxID=2493646 RepID=A0AAE0RRX4_9BIVA|nr:hypothetical protein CHS0354_020584 [Potamilus streckersoni]
MKIQLRWARHVSRMEDYRLPKIALYDTHHLFRRPQHKLLTVKYGDLQITVPLPHLNKTNVPAWRGKKAKKEPRTHYNPDLPLQRLWTDMPVTYWAHQPPACMQQTWTSPFLNLREQNQANNNNNIIILMTAQRLLGNDRHDKTVFTRLRVY